MVHQLVESAGSLAFILVQLTFMCHILVCVDIVEIGIVIMRKESDDSTLYLALACCLLLKVLSETVQVVW